MIKYREERKGVRRTRREIREVISSRRGPLPFTRMAAELVLARSGESAGEHDVAKFLVALKKRRTRKKPSAK